MFTEDYTFYATVDDGVRLWINGQEIINGWVNELPTTYRASVPLVAQERYNVEMDYFYQNDGSRSGRACFGPVLPPRKPSFLNLNFILTQIRPQLSC